MRNYQRAIKLLKSYGIPYRIPEHNVIHIGPLKLLHESMLLDVLVLGEKIMELGGMMAEGHDQIDFIFDDMTAEKQLNKRAKQVVGDAIVGEYAGNLIGVRYERQHITHLEVSAKRSLYHGTMLGTNVDRIAKVREKYGQKKHVLFVYVVTSEKAVFTMKGEHFFHAIDTGIAKIHPHKGKNIWMLPVQYFREEFGISEEEFEELRKLHDAVKRTDENQKGLFDDES